MLFCYRQNLRVSTDRAFYPCASATTDHSFTGLGLVKVRLGLISVKWFKVRVSMWACWSMVTSVRGHLYWRARQYVCTYARGHIDAYPFLSRSLSEKRQTFAFFRHVDTLGSVSLIYTSNFCRHTSRGCLYHERHRHRVCG